MAKATILFADNDPDFLKTRAEFLEQEGYLVVPATSVTEAQRKLEIGGIGLAIIDIRLENDDDEKDTSGLVLARDVARSVPKIILTGFPSYQYVREALQPQLDGLPAAVDFVAKQEGPEALLRAIKSTLSRVEPEMPKQLLPSARELEGRLAPVSFPIAMQLLKDYEEVRKEVTFTYRARLVCVVVGALVILSGGIGVLTGQVAVGALSAVSGIIAEALVALFTRFARDAHRRMDQYHKELVMFYKKETNKERR
jgi:CheY-like chemotaxis protein